MQRIHSKLFRQTVIMLGLLLTSLLILTACGSNSVSTAGSTNGSATTLVGSNVTTTTLGNKTVGNVTDDTTPAPAVTLGAQACPASVSAPAHWDFIIGTQANLNKVERVTCANLIGKNTLQALVNVRIDGTGAFLDVYIYDNITSANPTQLFKLQGLDHGDAKISGYNTIITGEVDAQSSVNKNVTSNAGLVMDLYREFKWSDGAGTFVQITFPGIFPDLTRYQAEANQQQVNQGHQPWKLDAAMSANALAVTMLKWSTSATTTIVSGGGQHDATAVVSVKSTNPGAGSIQVAMARLEGNTNGGIWIATGVTSTGMSLTAPAQHSTLTSPTTVTGTGNAFEGNIGAVTILDHTYTDIGNAAANGAVGNGNTTFATSVNYTSSFKGGTQEGIVALYSHNNAGDGIAGAVMVKVLLSA